ncbi:MAG: GTPase HflX [Anaerovoracaceae bacterium]|jgi:GTP-binding protein HflX
MIEFNEKNETVAEKTTRAILMGVSFGEDISESMKELENLAASAGAEVLGVMEQSREKPESATYIGKGKVEELAEMCGSMEADSVIFNNELSGVQIRNLEDALGVSVIDRTVLILDIFASRAASSAGKLQVELAQLQYRLPRLTGFGGALSRTGGGIGTRGPGEKKLETDRRHIQSRIDEIRRELKDAEKARDITRRKREKNDIPAAALVGYTNAGKSAVMNMMLSLNESQGTEVLEKNMLFATLDVSHRRISFGQNRTFILTDTVGFVSKLPHTLVEAFKGTLEEALYADLIINVTDISDPDYQFKMDVTDKLLNEIGAGDIPRINVFNKMDLVDSPSGIVPDSPYESVYISAKYGDGADEFRKLIEDKLFSDEKEAELLVPYDKGSITSYLCDKCAVKEMDYRADGTYFRVMLPKADYQRFRQYFITDKAE